ncbi:MAG: dihydrofolate reductase [Rhizobiaceae bacterium]
MTIDISIIVAAAENNVIGSDGDMPWHLSTDLKRFRELTMGKPMIMGRKTFAAIGKPLPGRTSIVVTRDSTWQSEGVLPVDSLETAIVLAKQIAADSGVDRICIVGGGEIYRQSIEIADLLYLTRVHAEPGGDTVFPIVDPEVWLETGREVVPAGEKDTFDTSFIDYERRQSVGAG